jgi:hypothetical protein
LPFQPVALQPFFSADLALAESANGGNNDPFAVTVDLYLEDKDIDHRLKPI